MCRLLYVTLLAYFFTLVSCRVIVPLEGPLWRSNIAEDITSPEDNLQFLSDFFDQRYPHQLVQYNADFEDLLAPGRSQEKRGLSMLSRWNFIDKIGKERTPIRSKPFYPEQGGINTQTRSKMLGAPLRWG
ncbi:unnamed protein product [Brassicogethes aeneus]|uniref:Uncharacterized protein n=1 Tax=Brassicogethes aeneus TaxID=1431903 RepID=A0A9P0B9M6_BRAAE|nr:unnamed protein product [Brassicogethes aeneus]